MQEQSPIGPGEGRTIAYQTQREYQPSNALRPKSALLAGGLGVICAVASAAVFLLWMISGIAVIVGLMGAVQGLIFGLLLRVAFRKAKLRNFSLAIIICTLCGALSGVLSYGGLYVHQAYQLQRIIRQRLGASQNPASARLVNMSDRPIDIYNAFVLRPETGHGGLAGFFLSKKVVTLGGEPVRVLVPFGVNLFLLLFVSVKVSKSQLRRPFCEECGAWFGLPSNAAVLPADRYGLLVAVIESGEPEAAIELMRDAAGEDLVGGCAVAQVHKCAGCGGMFVDVVLKHTGAADRPIAKPMRVTPEMLQALRSEPVVAIAEAPKAQENSGPDMPSQDT